MCTNKPDALGVALKHVATLRKLLNGNWVDTDDVCAALNIDFAQGMKMFDFGRTAAWNPAPKNGQKICTKFRLSEKTVQPPKDFDMSVAEDDFLLDLIFEQQGGIL